MPRSFRVSTETTAEVPAVLAAFGKRDYWLARLAAYGGDSMSLDSLAVAVDGALAVATSQDLRHDMVPAVITRALPGATEILRTESWRPVGGEVHGKVTITARGVPGSGAGVAVLEPVSGGCRLNFSGTLQVRVPLVGGRIEKYIADLIVKEMPQMHQFTTEWISDNA